MRRSKRERKSSEKAAAAEEAESKSPKKSPKKLKKDKSIPLTRTLKSGYKMPVFCLGTWKSPTSGATQAAVEAAIRAGYRGIDAANDYNNEHEVGAAIAKCIAEGVVTREELFVQAKLWNTNHRPEHVGPDLQQTLKDLQLTYVDSFVIHWPQAAPSSGKFCSTRLTGANTGHWSTNPMFPVDDEGYFCADNDSHYTDTWVAMEKLVDEGVVRSIGLSNFNKTQIAEVLAIAKKPVDVLQNECHAYLQQKELIDFCNFNGIAFQAYSPLGSGDTNLAVHSSPTGCIPLKDPTIARIAEETGKNPGQVMLRWAVQRGVTVVSKSVSPARIASNIQVFDWELSEQQMQAFDKLNCGWRHLLWRETSNHADYPFKDELPHDYKLEKAPTITSSGN